MPGVSVQQYTAQVQIYRRCAQCSTFPGRVSYLRKNTLSKGEGDVAGAPVCVLRSLTAPCTMLYLGVQGRLDPTRDDRDRTTIARHDCSLLVLRHLDTVHSDIHSSICYDDGPDRHLRGSSSSHMRRVVPHVSAGPAHLLSIQVVLVVPPAILVSGVTPPSVSRNNTKNEYH
jgi:hypothetical protein